MIENYIIICKDGYFYTSEKLTKDIKRFYDLNLCKIIKVLSSKDEQIILNLSNSNEWKCLQYKDLEKWEE